MDATQIYAIAAGSAFALLLFYHCYSHICRWIQNRTLWFVFKHLVYPILLKRRWFFKPYTRWQCLLLISYWLGTASCNVVGVHTLLHFSSRAGILSVLNIVPLFFSDRLSFAADLLGLSFRGYRSIHSAIAYMALIQGLVHTIITVRQGLHFREPLHFYGLFVSRGADFKCEYSS